jgi:hypothetical protein
MGLSLWSAFNFHVPARFGLPATGAVERAEAAEGWSDGAAPGKGPDAFCAAAFPAGKSASNKKSAVAHRPERSNDILGCSCPPHLLFPVTCLGVPEVFC